MARFRPSRRIALAFALCTLLAGPVPSGQAQGGDDAAVAVNTRDGASVFRFSFSVRRIMGEVVDTQNAAVAYASCSSCETVAIAIQLVLVSGSPQVVTPENLAIAINDGCVECETFASAYQFVLGVGDRPVRFTAEGNRTLAQLRSELARLRQGDLSLDELDRRVEDLTSRLRQVVADELVATGPSQARGETTTTTETRASPPTTAETTEPATTETESPPPTTTTTTPTTTTTTTTTTETEPPPPTEATTTTETTTTTTEPTP